MENHLIPMLDTKELKCYDVSKLSYIEGKTGAISSPAGKKKKGSFETLKSQHIITKESFPSLAIKDLLQEPVDTPKFMHICVELSMFVFTKEGAINQIAEINSDQLMLNQFYREEKNEVLFKLHSIM